MHADILGGILQDGRRVGVHVIATAPRRTGITSGLQSAFGQRLVLRMPIEDDYAMLGAPTGVLDADSAAGRALLGKHELQIATIGGAGTPLQAERLAKLAELLADAAPAVAVPAMPGRLPESAMPVPTRNELPVAVDADFVSAISVGMGRGPLLVAGRSGTGRTSMLLGIAQLARRSSEPPAEIVLVGPRVTDALAAAPDAVDRVISDPVEVATGAAALAVPPAGGGWRLVLVDDAQIWERDWEKGGPARDAATALAELVGATGPSLAVVVAGDSDDARTRQHVTGPVQVARRGRVGVLLQPDLPDGSILGTTVPTHTVEPLVGVGRGLFCEGGAARVVQVISNATPATPATPATSDVISGEGE